MEDEARVNMRWTLASGTYFLDSNCRVKGENGISYPRSMWGATSDIAFLTVLFPLYRWKGVKLTQRKSLGLPGNSSRWFYQDSQSIEWTVEIRLSAIPASLMRNSNDFHKRFLTRMETCWRDAARPCIPSLTVRALKTNSRAQSFTLSSSKSRQEWLLISLQPETDIGKVEAVLPGKCGHFLTFVFISMSGWLIFVY